MVGLRNPAPALQQIRVAGVSWRFEHRKLTVSSYQTGQSCSKLLGSSYPEFSLVGSLKTNFQRLWMHLLRKRPLKAGGQQTKTPNRLKVEGSMVSKCANPACSTPFHYLREGKIFRVEVEVTPPATAEDTFEPSNGNKLPFLVEARKPSRKLEHFWLCGPCSQSMSLLFDRENGISVIPKLRTRAAASAAAS